MLKKNNRDLVNVMTKLEGKRPMCLEFCVRASGCLNNHFETHRKFIEEKYSALATANYENLWSTYFRCTDIELISAVLLQRT